MNQIFSVVGLNSVGLALATWGVTMLIGTHHPFLPIVEVILTSVGLGMIAIGTGWLTFLMFVGASRQAQETDLEGVPTRTTTPTTPVPRRDKLAAAMEDLQRSALSLIERRRELHHLNVHQWHHAHPEETSMEIEANKQYRKAKSNLEFYRQSLPTKFWGPVDSFAGSIEERLSREAYSPPKDKQVHEDFNQSWHAAMQELNDITFSLPPTEPVSATSVV